MEDLLWFKERQKECGVEIPYLFHAGETVTDGGKADMVSLNPVNLSVVYILTTTLLLESVRRGIARHQENRTRIFLTSTSFAHGDLPRAEDSSGVLSDFERTSAIYRQCHDSCKFSQELFKTLRANFSAPTCFSLSRCFSITRYPFHSHATIPNSSV